MQPAIVFERVSKHYRGVRTYRTLRDDVAGVLGRVTRRTQDTVWERFVVRALDDVGFEIPEGQSFALIGPNGAGKTTALRLASRITYPTSGRIRIRGRVGALIEVGTGLHPELTGRENVDLHGRILGLSKREVRQRFEQMAEFAGLGRAIDQPIKRFSSGMQLRIGFAIASHLDPDVLLVDEAIAVGDLAFQHRCVERMRNLVAEGRTVVFVSHDVAAIEALCVRAVLLREGRIVEDGPARDVVRAYVEQVERERVAEDVGGARSRGDRLVIERVGLEDASGREVTSVEEGATLAVRLHYRAGEPIRSPAFSIGLSDGRQFFAFASTALAAATPPVLDGHGTVSCTLDELPLSPSTYEVWGAVEAPERGALIPWQRLRVFQVTGERLVPSSRTGASAVVTAPVRLPHRWSFESDG